MKPSRSQDHDEQDQELIRLLKELGPSDASYPSELLAVTRAAFLAQVDRLVGAENEDGLTAEDQEFVGFLRELGSMRVAYPAELLAARRTMYLNQLERAGGMGRPGVLQRIFGEGLALPDLRRFSLVMGSLAAALLLGVLFLNRARVPTHLSPTQAAFAPSGLSPSNTGEVALLICRPEETTDSCPTAADLSDTGDGMARPAVAKDVYAYGDHMASYVNDGRGGESWVSESADSWIKIDLGQARTINTVSLQKGTVPAAASSDPGQFRIAVALTDVYADGDSNNDEQEYAQVFHSEQTGFSGTVSDSETIRGQFPAVQARFVKITFENAGAAIQEVGVFLVEPATPRPDEESAGKTPVASATSTATIEESATSALTGTLAATMTNSPIPSTTNTALPTDTPSPIPTEPLPSETPLPPPTLSPPTAIPPTAIPPTAIPATVVPPVSAEAIVVTGSDQTLTFTCADSVVEVRGRGNIITLLGSCSSITVTGNGNHIFWESGSPVITNRGNNNIIEQL